MCICLAHQTILQVSTSLTLDFDQKPAIDSECASVSLTLTRKTDCSPTITPDLRLSVPLPVFFLVFLPLTERSQRSREAERTLSILYEDQSIPDLIRPQHICFTTTPKSQQIKSPIADVSQ